MSITHTTYVTKALDVLDRVCWKHYGQRALAVDTAVAVGPMNARNASDLVATTMGLAPLTAQNLDGIVEAVLLANPGLADLGEVLPEGVSIILPDFDDDIETPGVVHLWHD